MGSLDIPLIDHNTVNANYLNCFEETQVAGH